MESSAPPPSRPTTPVPTAPPTPRICQGDYSGQNSHEPCQFLSSLGETLFCYYCGKSYTGSCLRMYKYDEEAGMSTAILYPSKATFASPDRSKCIRLIAPIAFLLLVIVLVALSVIFA